MPTIGLEVHRHDLGSGGVTTALKHGSSTVTFGFGHSSRERHLCD